MNQVQPTSAALLTDQPPAPPPVAPLPHPNSTQQERMPAQAPEQDEDTVTFEVLAVALLLAPLVAILGQRLAWDSPALWAVRAALLALCGVAFHLAFRLEPRAPKAPAGRIPPEPVRETVTLPRPPEPLPRVLQPAPQCRVCGRALTDPVDRELGVDNSCYVRHGAHRVYIDNPAHAQWLVERHEVRDREVRLQAEADQQHRQALAQWQSEHGDQVVEHRREQARWLDDIRAHDSFLRSPAGRKRVARARSWRTASAGALGLFVIALL